MTDDEIYFFKYVSSHAPVRGHRYPPASTAREASFKSCPREGASANWYKSQANKHVSSHAPVRGHQEIGRRVGINDMFQVMPP